MNIEALEQLSRVVEDAPDDLLHMRAIVEEAHCGTARCALGWAIVDPWFQQNTAINELIKADFKERTFSFSTSRLAEIFDITFDDAENLFALDMVTSVDEHAVSKDEVLWNIDNLIAGRWALPYEATEADVPVYANDIENPAYDEPREDDDPPDLDEEPEEDEPAEDSEENLPSQILRHSADLDE